MILKIQKPLYSTDNENFYLVYNKNKSIILQDVEVGQCKTLDKMFKGNELKIFIEGYIDKKDRLVIKRKVEQQDW